MDEFYYSEYLNKLDELMTIENDPKLLEDIITTLKIIKYEYNDLDYDKEHFEYMYINLLEKIVTYANNGDYDSLHDIYINFFLDNEDYHNKLKEFAYTLSVLCNIHEESVNERIKEAALRYYTWVYNEERTEISESLIDKYKYQFDNFINAINLIADFTEEPQIFDSEHFIAYINKLVSDMIFSAELFKVDEVIDKIQSFKSSDLPNGLNHLSQTLNKLYSIKKSSEDDLFNSKIEELLDEIKNESYLTINILTNYENKAKELINEYRYG